MPVIYVMRKTGDLTLFTKKKAVTGRCSNLHERYVQYTKLCFHIYLILVNAHPPDSPAEVSSAFLLYHNLRVFTSPSVFLRTV